MAQYDDLKSFVDSLEEDFGKFYAKGNKAADTRVRKAMQRLRAMSQVIRKEIQDIKNQ